MILRGTRYTISLIAVTAWLVAGICIQAGATNYFVSPTGDNANNGLDSASAWASINHGDTLGIIAPGDTIFVMSGTYPLSSSAVFSQSGLVDSHIVYCGVGEPFPVLDGGDNAFNIIEVNGERVTFVRLHIANSTDNGFSLYGSGNTIEKCVISRIKDYGIYLASGADSARIYNNTLYGAYNIGVYPNNSVKTARIINNIIDSCITGIWAASDNLIAHNNIWRAGNNYFGGAFDSAGGISEDPLFVNPSTDNLALQSMSPCIDAGMDVGVAYIGDNPDMGAIEYAVSGGTVYWVSPTGDDSNDGLDSTRAWASIDNGDLKSLIEPGDTINILPGAYPISSTIHLTTSGTQSAPIIYQKFGQDAAIIDGGGVYLELLYLDCNNVVVEGLEFTGTSAIQVTMERDSCVLKRCYLHGGGLNGVAVNGNDNLVLGSVISGVDNAGVEVGNAANDNRVYDNTISGATTGVSIGGSIATTRIFNNIIVSTNVGITGKSGNICGFNNVWDFTSVDYTNGLFDSAGGISADPMFVDSQGGDFRLQPGSPCIDAGLYVGFPFNGTAPDMGALESDLSVSTVYWVSTVGSDSNDGLDSTSAWASVDRGDQLGVLNPGDVINILPGFYTLPASIDLISSGTQFQPIVYRKFGNDVALLDLDGLDTCAVSMSGSHTYLMDLEIANAGRDGIILRGDSCLVTGCNVHHCGLHSIDIEGSDNDVLKNIFRDAGESGIVMRAGADDNRIYGNTVYECPLDGVWIDPSVSSTRVFNNIVMFAGDAIEGPIGNVCGFNNTWSSTTNDYIGGVTDSAGGLSADPQFVDPPTGDFELEAGSACIDAGLDVGYPFHGLAPDMGAIESSSFAAVDYIRIEMQAGDPPGDTVISADETITLYCRGYTSGDALVGDVEVSWTFAGGDSIGSFSATEGPVTTIDLTTPGVTAIAVEYSGALVDTSGTITCIPGVPAMLVIEPDSATISADSALQFSSITLDADGNVSIPQIVPDWTVTNGIGSINPSGWLTPDSVGTGVVIASGAGLVDSTGPITVTPGVVASIVITPEAATVERHSSTQFSVTGYDARGNATNPGEITWSVLGRVGSIDSTGFFTGGDPGYGLIVARNEARILSDTTGQIIVEALAVSAIPLGQVVARPGQDNAAILALHVDNYYAVEKQILSVTLREALSGIGNPLQVLSNVDGFALYLDVNRDSLLSDVDSMICSVPAESDSVVLSFDPLPVSSGASIDLFVAAAVGTHPRDGDTLDCYMRPLTDVTPADSAVVAASDSINSHGYGIIDGMLANQLTVHGSGSATMEAGDSLYRVFTIDIPRNGYSEDTLEGFGFLNDGTAEPSDFEYLALYRDNGNSVWGTASEESLLGEFAFTGSEWNITGLKAPLIDETTRFYVGAMLSRYPINGNMLIPRIPASSVEVASHNDGPLDYGIEIGDTLTISSNTTIQVSSTEIESRSLVPGSMTGALLDITLTNGFSEDIVIDSIEFASLAYDPDGATQAELDIQFDSVLLYANVDGDVKQLGLFDTLISSGTVSDGSIILGTEGLVLPGHGGQFGLTLEAHLSLANAKDANEISFAILSEKSIYLDSAYTIDSPFPVQNEKPFVVDAFPAAAITLTQIEGRNLYADNVPHPVLDFMLPPNGYASDELVSISVRNTGGFRDSDTTVALTLWRDVGGDGLTGDDTFLGEFTHEDGHWNLKGISCPLTLPQTRLIVGAMVLSGQFEGGTLRFEIPAGGVLYASDTDGPDDEAVFNDDAHVVLPSNRITLISIPEASSPVPPASEDNLILTFALYNGYLNQDKTLQNIRFSNYSKTASTPDFADYELGQLQLYVDRNQDRILNDDSLLATGYMVNGKLVFAGLKQILPAESLAYFFVVTDIPANAIDSDSLAIGIKDNVDLGFSETVAINGDLPLVSGGYLIVDGSLAMQYDVLELASRTLSPADSGVTLFGFRPALNGNVEDTLVSVNLANIGTAAPGDLQSLSLWKDINGDEFWQAGDSLLGWFTFGSGLWTAGAIDLPLMENAPALLAVADIDSVGTPGATITFQIPVNGCQYSSQNDGPLDSPVGGDNVFTISYTGLRATQTPMAPPYSVGQSFEVRFTATNLLTVGIDSVIGSIVLLGDSTRASSDSSVLGPFDLAAGASVDFVRYLTAQQPGSVSFEMRALTESGNDSSAAIYSQAIDIESIPSQAGLQMIDAIPAAVTRGQSNVFPLSLSVTHQDTGSAVAALRIDSLRMHVCDGSDNPIPANSVFSRIILSTAYETVATLATVPGTSSVLLEFMSPLLIASGEDRHLALLVDIDSVAVPDEFSVSIQSAADITVVDGNSMQSVPIDPGTEFPLATASCRIEDPSTKLFVSSTATMAPAVNYGQQGVGTVQLNLLHPGIPGSSQIQLSAVNLRFADDLGSLVRPADVFSSVWLARDQVILAEKEGYELDSTVTVMQLSSPVILGPGQIDSIQVMVSIAETSSLAGFEVIISDSTDLTVRDVSSGSVLSASTDTTVLSTGSVFPVTSGLAEMKTPAQDPELCITQISPPAVISGADSLSLVRLDFEYPYGSGYSAIKVVDVGVAILDTLGIPLNSNDLFDRIGIRSSEGILAYQTFVEFHNGLTQFHLGDTGLVIQPGTSAWFDLVADLEADPTDIDHFSIVVADANCFTVVDQTDTTSILGVAVAPLCSDAFPFVTNPTEVIMPAGEPVVRPGESYLQIVSRGQENVRLFGATLDYAATDARGNLLINDLTASVWKRDANGLSSFPGSQIFESVNMNLGDVHVASDTTLNSETIDLVLDSVYVLAAGTSCEIEILCNIRSNAPVGNYILSFGDSLFLGMTDQSLSTAIAPALAGTDYPLYSIELSLTAPGLAQSFGNFPNPFRPYSDGHTTLSYTLTRDAHVDIEIFTITSDPVCFVARGEFREAGPHQEDVWAGLNDVGREVVSGTYICRITATYTTGETETHRTKVAVVR